MAFLRTQDPVKFNLKHNFEINPLSKWMSVWKKTKANDDEHNQILTTLVTYTHPHCWVVPAKPFSQISDEQKTSFAAEYRLVIHSDNILYHALFAVPFEKIKNLHKKVHKMERHFPSTGFSKGMSFHLSSPTQQYNTQCRTRTCWSTIERAHGKRTWPSKKSTCSTPNHCAARALERRTCSRREKQTHKISSSWRICSAACSIRLRL